MNAKRILVTVAGLAGIVLLAGFAGRCGHRPTDPARMAAFITDRVDDALDDLDASDAQRAEVHAIKDRLLEKAEELHQQGEPTHGQVLAQWNSPNPDRALLHSLVDQRLEAIRVFAHEAVDAGIEVHDLLTPEQRAKVAKKVERMHRCHP
ncbi:MAG TPA: Spy/CpxP family protein refolding chaperone [Anaeromyxobacter sp.]|nr:Spy/CpxP family protein refolding chaperone [Anaeromyxobacter sp.]